MAGPSETPHYVPPLVLSQAQQIYQHGVPVTEYYGDPELDSQRSALWTNMGPTVPGDRKPLGAHGRADPAAATAYPTAAAPGGW